MIGIARSQALSVILYLPPTALAHVKPSLRR